MRLPSAVIFRISVRGEWPKSGEGPRISGFYRIYQVGASSVESALTYARDLEPEGIRATVQLHEIQDQAPAADVLAGVYWRSVYIFW